MRRWLAGQFAHPKGLAGRLFLGAWLDRISREMNRLALAEMAPGPEDVVLEIGFGGGALLAMILAATRGRVIGVDVSRAMATRARRRFRSERRLRLIEASVDALPLETASVDKGCSVNSLYFWPEPAAAMSELARVIRPGGTLTITFEPPEELRKWPGHRFGFQLFEEAEVAAMMAGAGFRRIRRAEGRGRRPERFLALTGERAAAEAAP